MIFRLVNTITLIALTGLCSFAVQYRNPSFATYRFWMIWMVLIGVGAIALRTLFLLRHPPRPEGKKTSHRTSHRIGLWLSLLLSTLCLSILLTQEGKFWLTKYSVLHQDPALLQKLGQHFIVGYRNFGEVQQLVEKRAIAGVFITARNVESQSIPQIQQQIQTLQSIRERQNLPPLWIATDQEGGVVSNLSPPLPFQPAIATAIDNRQDPQQTVVQQTVVQYATMQAQALHQLGVNLNFAPVVDLKGKEIAGDRFSLISRRAISADPATVSRVAALYCDTLMQFQVQCTVKHFPGLGSLQVDTHTAAAILDVAIAQLERADWIPFRALMQRPKTWVMMGHAILPEVDPIYPASFSQQIVTQLIRQKWRYRGILVTDDIGMQAAYQHPAGFEQMVVRVLNAGVDVILDSFDQDLFYPAMQALIRAEQSGQLDQSMLQASQQRLDLDKT